MKRLKKSVATVLAFVMVWSLMSLQSFGATITKSTTWDFTKWTAQTLTNDYSYDNLTVTATSTKKVSINSGINLGGGGAVDYRSIAFTATGPCTISATVLNMAELLQVQAMELVLSTTQVQVKIFTFILPEVVSLFHLCH